MPIHADIARYNDALEPPFRSVADLLATEIDAALPDAESKIWHAHPVWFLEGNPIVGYSKLKGPVRLLFWSGQSFDLPGLAPGGTFKAAEARYSSVDEVDVKQLALWLAASREIQWDYQHIRTHRGLVPRKGLSQP
ncbi:DUF1801 domain-containing protein [Demequina sp. NBRC 110053]|uniref:DUF1801 domain-containing protein n=1 Tax=Demequina sp. NBRC 110053 TaxID=1570342 RepID=UPI000A046027|nr:DUF1801 domain-containing protein [Demequina sp. NBRC 110053]